MKVSKLLFATSIIFLICSCSNSVDTSQSVQKLKSNKWTNFEGHMVYYAESCPGYGGYIYSIKEIINGEGTIDVDVIQSSGDIDTPYGIEYAHPTIWGQSFDFRLKTTGYYKIGWLDGAENMYGETGWKFLDSINKGLGKRNVLSIKYNTANKSFVFLINGNEVLSKTFSKIEIGQLGYYCEIPQDANESNPYEFKYKTTSPFVNP